MNPVKNTIQEHWNRVIDRVKPRKRTVAGAIVVIAVGWYFLLKNSNGEMIMPKRMATVASGDIVNSIKVVGNTKITDQQTLTFGQQGTVKTVYVKEGQAVKKWDLLAVLDKKSLSNNIAQQSLSIQNARINYQKLFTSTSESDIINAKNNITNAESKLKVAKQELDDMMLSNGDTLQTKASSVQSVLISTKSSINELRKIFEDIDDMFSITEKTNSDEINRLISAKMPSYKTMTESTYQIAMNKLNTLESTYNMIQAKTSTTVTEMEGLQERNKDVLNALSTCIANAKNAMDNSIVSVDLTDSKLSSWKSTLNSANSSVISRLSSLNSEGKSLRTTSTDIQNKKTEISNYESQLKMYQENYQDLVNWPSREDRQLQMNNIKSMQISLSELSDQGKDYEIKAPFDGNVDIVDVQVGDNITSDNISEKTITVSNPNIYEIEMLIDQVDIVKINKGQPVEISFDAYSWYVVTGEISEIDPTPTTSAGVVSYTARVVKEKWDKKIYDSMTVTVKIITERKLNTIIVPSMAIQTESGNTIVQVQNRDGTVTSKKVITGITDSSNTEILSGLNIGERIYLETYTLPTSSKTTSTTNSDKANNARSSTRSLGVGGSSSMGAGGPPM